MKARLHGVVKLECGCILCGSVARMKKLIHDDFLLDTREARTLYHDYAAGQPIVDYHCHLPPAEVAADKRWENISQVWLHGDHYKWRAMRSNGVAERYCTGDASDREKFDQFAASMPYFLRNPLVSLVASGVGALFRAG
jgi:glucuronate isomerase